MKATPLRVTVPAAIGIPIKLYMEAKTKFMRMRLVVIFDSFIAATTSNRLFWKNKILIWLIVLHRFIKTVSYHMLAVTLTNTMPADSIATSDPLEIAIPTSACVNAGLSFTPSPTIAT